MEGGAACILLGALIKKLVFYCNEFGFLWSDYGRWSSEEQMITPYIFKGADGVWHCVWALNEREHLSANASSNDLID